jgi:hypothetical protein
LIGVRRHLLQAGTSLSWQDPPALGLMFRLLGSINSQQIGLARSIQSIQSPAINT